MLIFSLKMAAKNMKTIFFFNFMIYLVAKICFFNPIYILTHIFADRRLIPKLCVLAAILNLKYVSSLKVSTIGLLGPYQCALNENKF